MFENDRQRTGLGRLSENRQIAFRTRAGFRTPVSYRIRDVARLRSHVTVTGHCGWRGIRNPASRVRPGTSSPYRPPRRGPASHIESHEYNSSFCGRRNANVSMSKYGVPETTKRSFDGTAVYGLVTSIIAFGRRQCPANRG